MQGLRHDPSEYVHHAELRGNRCQYFKRDAAESVKRSRTGHLQHGFRRGDTSTNDTVLLLANGLAGNPEITEENEDYKIFKEALFEVNKTQAMHIAGDGEGATALFEVTIQGAESKEQAVTLAKSVITSSLTKAAIFGHDANWGRILCAMGYSGAKFDPENVDLYFESAAGKLQIITKGVAVDYSEEEATKILSEPKVTATADIHMGEATATAWGCDLTYDYVKINADYRS